MKNTIYIETEKLKEFPDNPYRVKDDEEMENLIQSIKEHGILSPIIARPLENGEYEIISGHRRVHAANLAGITKVPALTFEMDRDSASIMLVDSNLHREHILPSEKAHAYKLKMEAMSRQGHRSDLTSGQLVSKSDENRTTSEIGKANNESYKTVQRYIRLTYLIPEILELVDEGKIALTPAVYLSYLTDEEQYNLLDVIECEDATPSLSQAVRMRDLSKSGKLQTDDILKIMSEEKPNQKERIKIPADKIRKYFPENFSESQIENEIIRLCKINYRKRKQEQER